MDDDCDCPDDDHPAERYDQEEPFEAVVDTYGVARGPTLLFQSRRPSRKGCHEDSNGYCGNEEFADCMSAAFPHRHDKNRTA